MTDHSTALRIAAAALALGLPGAALAGQASNPAKAVAATTPSGSVATAPTTAKGKRYCVLQTITGSRVPVKTCNTREEWLSQGFDPLAPEKP